MSLFDKVSDFMSGSRKKSRKRIKRTVKVCYCEKKYLARDGSKRSKRYKCACKGRADSARRRPKKWMQKATKRSHHGALHRTLGIPQGQTIPYKLKNEGCKNPRRTLKRVTGKTPTKRAARKFQKQACLARTYAERGGRKYPGSQKFKLQKGLSREEAFSIARRRATRDFRGFNYNAKTGAAELI